MNGPNGHHKRDEELTPEELAAREHRRRHRKTFTLATASAIVTICVVILPIVSWLAGPRIIKVMSNAMAGEIAAEVAKQIKPTNERVDATNAGLRVMVEAQIADLEDDISALEFKREMCQGQPPCWSAGDMQTLTNKRRRLRTQNEALDAMKAAEASQPTATP